jgi:hypothetical protein
LYRPRLTGYTWILWYGPFVLLGLGVIVVLILGRRKKLSKAGAQAFDADNSAPNTTAATDHNARLGALLKSTDNSDRAGKQSDQQLIRKHHDSAMGWYSVTDIVSFGFYFSSVCKNTKTA